MAEYYLQIRWTHVAAILASGGLFLIRGLAIQAGARWPMEAGVRYLSYSVDTVLLTAALMLLTILPRAVFANGWLTAKLCLVAAYVVLGSYAFRRGRTPRVRAICLAGAVLTYGSIVAMAWTHDPLGPLRLLSRLAD